MAQAKDLAAQKEANTENTDTSNINAINALFAQVANISAAATFNVDSVLGDNTFQLAKDDGTANAKTVTFDALPTALTGTTAANIQTDIGTVLGYQATAGGAEAGLGYLADFLTSKAAYMQEAATNATAVNITTEMSDYVSNQIALQSAQFIAAQQNQNAYSVLNLLK